MPSQDAATRWQATEIRGVIRRALSPMGDARGSFTELWRASWTEPIGAKFCQANLSRSHAGVLRGLHFHDCQADLWVVTEGLASVALVDLRGRIADPAVVPVVAQFEMSPASAVYIPPGVAHGFLALERLALLYLVTQEYDGTDEHGFVWNDPTAAIDWPTASPILSGRDSSNPTLDEAVAEARQRGLLASVR